MELRNTPGRDGRLLTEWALCEVPSAGVQTNKEAVFNMLNAMLGTTLLTMGESPRGREPPLGKTIRSCKHLEEASKSEPLCKKGKGLAVAGLPRRKV